MGGPIILGMVAEGLGGDLFRSRFAETLGWVLVHSLWEIAAVGILCALVLTALRRASANLRYAVACAGFLLMVGVVIGTYVYLLPPAPPTAREVVDLPAVSVRVQASRAEMTDPSAYREIGIPRAVAKVEVPWTLRARRAVRPWLPAAEGVYLLGMMVLLARLAAGYGRLRGLVQRGAAIEGMALERLESLARRMGVRRAVRLLESSAVEVPTLLGMVKPVILLPAAALAGLSVEQLEALLAHELAHIRRHDYAANLVQSFLETVLFYHPAVWWLSARIRQERENCCDDAAVLATSDRVAYARALAAMEVLRVPGGMALAARGGRLLPRIRRILGEGPHAPSETRFSLRGKPGSRRMIPTAVAAVLIVAVTALIYIGCSKSADTGSAAKTQPGAETQADAAALSSAAGGISETKQQIAAEARIITVPTKLLEELLKKQGSPSPASAEGGGPQVIQTNAVDDTNKDVVTRLVDDLKLEKEAKTVSAPRLLLLSGEPGIINVTKEQNYIKGFKKTPGENGAPDNVTLDVQTLTTGLELGITATAQGGKILTEIHPKLTDLLGIDTISESEEARARGEIIQVPKITTTEFQTTATVADGGMLLISGKGVTSEREVESSVPGLSKLPGVGGLFTNRKYEPVEETLLVIVQVSTVKREAAADAAAPFDPQEFNLVKDDPPADRAVRAKMEETLHELTITDQPLEKVVAYLRDNSGVSMNVNWEALKAAGVGPDAKVTMSLREVPFRKALTTVLSLTGADHAHLKFTVRDGEILITTAEALETEKETVVRSFDIRDMVLPPDARNAAQRKELLGSLIGTIQSTVAPDSWESNGGKMGTINEKEGHLVVKQTKENLLGVHNLLEQLRETRAIQIATESRVLLVSPNFLDDFRVGWDLKMPMPKADGSAMMTGGASIIDNWTLALLLQAQQADKRSIAVATPRMTGPNGYPGKIVISQTQGPALPATSNVPHYVIHITPTVSADRRYVVATLAVRVGDDEKALAAPAEREVTTMVSIPDGGTLLMDGGEVKGDGTPENPTRHALILVQPNIVVHSMQEKGLFDPETGRPMELPGSTGAGDSNGFRTSFTTTQATEENRVRVIPATGPAATTGATQPREYILYLDRPAWLKDYPVPADEAAAKPVAKPSGSESAITPATGTPMNPPTAELPKFTPEMLDREVEWAQALGTATKAPATRETVLAQYKANEKESADAVASGHLRRAAALAKMNGSLIDTNRNLFTDAEVKVMREASEKQAADAMAAEELHPEGERMPLAGERGTDTPKETQFSKAQELYVEGKYKEAAVLLNKILEVEPEDTSAKTVLKLVQKKLREEAATMPATKPSATAAAVTTRAATRAAKVAELTADARAFEASGDMQNAADRMRQAVIVDPQDAAARVYLDQIVAKLPAHSGNIPETGGSQQVPATNPSAVRGGKAGELIAAAHKAYEATKFMEAEDLVRQALVVDPENAEAQRIKRLMQDKIIGHVPPAADTQDSSISVSNATFVSAGEFELEGSGTPAVAGKDGMVVEVHEGKLRITMDGKVMEAANVQLNRAAGKSIVMDLHNGKVRIVQDGKTIESEKFYLAANGPEQRRGANAKGPYTDLTGQDATQQAREAQEAATNEAARKNLDETIIDLSATKEPLDKVINRLRDSAGINIFVNWTALHGVGVEKDTPVSIERTNALARQVLSAILTQAGGTTAHLAYTIGDGIVTVSTQDDLSSAKYQLVRVYDVRDLLLWKNLMPGDKAAQAQQQERIDDLLALIRSTVDPASWKDAGGAVGTIRQLNGQFIVNQTMENQVAVDRLLKELRATDGPQVLVKAVVMTMDDASAQQLFKANADKSVLIRGGDPEEKQNAALAGLLTAKGTEKMAELTAAKKMEIVCRPYLLLADNAPSQAFIGQEIPKIEGYQQKPGAPDEWEPQVTYLKVGMNLGLTSTVLEPKPEETERLVRLDLDWSSSDVAKTDEAAAPGVPADKDLKTYIPVLEERKATAIMTIKAGAPVLMMLPGVKDGQRMLMVVTPTVEPKPGNAAPVPATKSAE